MSYLPRLLSLYTGKYFPSVFFRTYLAPPSLGLYENLRKIHSRLDHAISLYYYIFKNIYIYEAGHNISFNFQNTF